MVPVTTLETNKGVPRQFDRVIDLVKTRQSGDVRIAAKSIRGTINSGAIYWRATASAHYLVDPIRGLYLDRKLNILYLIGNEAHFVDCADFCKLNVIRL